jgi:multimeric flavodoxin WrbA
MSLIVIHPSADDGRFDLRLTAVLAQALEGIEYRQIDRAEQLRDLKGQRLLFAVPLGEYGVNVEYLRLLRRLRGEPELLEGCTAGLLVDGAGELYTKSTAAELALALNLCGCTLIGRPLVEATGSLANFRIQAKNLGVDVESAYQAAARELVERLMGADFSKKERPELLVLHASSHHVSNTMQLWSKAAQRLGDACAITELGLRNGTLSDCSGCPYTMCLHFGEKGGCFYGGVMQDEVYPAVRRADAIVLLCPNYNDALSANLTAFINRLTALFRQTRFYDKAMFALVVSGYSGSDIVARQLISALNMNKSFYLPGRFAMLETANNPGEAAALPGIEERLDRFARNILDTLCK